MATGTGAQSVAAWFCNFIRMYHEQRWPSNLCRYADTWDQLLMLCGTCGAIVNGAGLPVFAIFLGDMINDLGIYQNDYDTLVNKVNESVPYFVYIGLVTFVGAYLQSFCWSTTAVRQVNRMRSMYLKHVLHQETGYFDTEGTSGFLLQGLNEDCNAIQQGIGEKVAMILFFMSTCVSGIIIAFVIFCSMLIGFFLVKNWYDKYQLNVSKERALAYSENPGEDG